MRRNSLWRRGFALIELIIVISIIAILSSLLLPALSKARGMAQRISCVNNMKQQGLGTQLYADSFDSYLPRAYKRWGWSYHIAEALGLITPWPGAMPSYSMDNNVSYAPRHPLFTCPAQPDRYGCNNASPVLAGNEQLLRFTIYAPTNTRPDVGTINGRSGGWRNSDFTTDVVAPEKKLERVLSGSVLMYEGWYTDAWQAPGQFQALVLTAPWGYSEYRNQLPGLSSYAHQPNYQRHSNMSNFLYNDGHVATHPGKQNFDAHWRPQ